jgi:transposase
LGHYAENTANEVDISVATFYNWMNRGRKERERLKMVPDAKPNTNETKYFKFLEAIEGARGKGTILLHSQVVKAAVTGDWRAAAYILERTRPEQYGNKEKLEHSGSVEGKLTVEMGDLEDKVLQLLEMRKAKGGK